MSDENNKQLLEIIERGGYLPSGESLPTPDLDTFLESGGYIPESTNS